MAVGLLLPLRVAQGVFAIVILGLSGYVAHWYNADTLTASPTQINFLIFVPAFSLLSFAYLEGTPRFLIKASHPYVHLTLEILNALFYFAGFIALSVFLAKLLFCRGTVCSAARADTVLAAFSFLLWAASSAIHGMVLFKGGLKSLKSAKMDEITQKAMKEESKGSMAPAGV